MKALLVKLIRAPRTVSLAAFDKILVPRWIRALGVQTGPECRFVGLPVIKMVERSRIVLGANVIVNSRSETNSAGLPHATILAACAANSAIIIRDDCGLSGVSISARSTITIGERVLVGAGACIWDHDFHPLNADERRKNPNANILAAPIEIESDVFIGARAMILKGVRVGCSAVIGAGAIVTRDVMAGDVVVGNPARVVGQTLSKFREQNKFDRSRAIE